MARASPRVRAGAAGWLTLCVLAAGCAARQPAPGPLAGHMHGGAEGGQVPLYERSAEAATPVARYFAATGPGLDYSQRHPLLGGAFATPEVPPPASAGAFGLPPERRTQVWLVQTRDCPREAGADPWPCQRVWRVDPHGRLVPGDARDLLGAAAGRPVLIVVQGYLTTPDIALGGLGWVQNRLESCGALPPDALMVGFDWPSSQVDPRTYHDINFRARVAFAAGYHLARLVEALPPDSRVCLLGHSMGGRVTTSALHLLGGGALPADAGAPVRLARVRHDLHLRHVFIAGAIDHHWLDPGEELDRALPACECFLNLHNSRDKVLTPYPILRSSDRRAALGNVGLRPGDRASLGPLLARYEEYDLGADLGREHTLLGALALPHVASRIAPYTWAAPR